MKGQGHKPANNRTESFIRGIKTDPCRDCAVKTTAKKDVDNLVEREINYRELLDNSPNALVIINLADESIIYANKHFCEQLHVPQEGITRYKAGDFIEDKVQVKKLFKELTSRQYFRNEEVLLKDKKGKVFWAEVSGGLVNFRKMDTACCTLKNITLKKKLETELKESEERFRNISESISDISYSCSQNASGVYQLNWIFGPTEKITGYSNKELLDLKCWGALVVAEDADLFRKKIIQTKPGKNNSCQLRITHKKGHLVWIMASARLAVHSVSGNYCLYGGIIDINDKKKAELSLAESEHLYRMLTHHLPLVIDRYDRDLKHVFINPVLEKYTGMKPKEFIGKKNVDINNGKDKYIEFNRSLANVFKTGRHHDLEWVFTTPHTGERIFFYTRMIPEFDANGVVNYVLCMTEDISERKRLDAMIARASVESEEKMRAAFASDLHDGLGPVLSSIKILNKTLEYDTSAEGFKAISDKINCAVDYSIGTIRELSHNMNPRILVNHGLNKALEYFLQSSRPDGLRVSYSNRFRERMDVSKETAVFRVVTELFGNTLKHSGATEVKISIRKIKECCKVHYSDNGCGFNTGATLSEYRSNGLLNIVNRMKAVNAIYEFKSKEGKGFSFNAQFKT